MVHAESISKALWVKYANIISKRRSRGTNSVKLKHGDTVRVVGSRRTAKIRAILTSMHSALLRSKSEDSGAGIWTSYDW